MKKKIKNLVFAITIFALTLALTPNFTIAADLSSANSSLETTNFSRAQLLQIVENDSLIEAYINETYKPIFSADLDSNGSLRAIVSKTLTMSVVKQENSYYCGPASCVMSAATLGLGTYSQSTMAAKIGCTTSGSSSDGITSGMNKLLSEKSKAGRYEKTNVSISGLPGSILYSVDKNFPVIVNVKVMPNYTVGVGHFIAAKGYSLYYDVAVQVYTIYFNDPHPTYYGSYSIDGGVLTTACKSNAGNFVRLNPSTL